MAQQIINIGAAPNDGSGDQLRVSFNKSNQNFTELYANGFIDAPSTDIAYGRRNTAWTPVLMVSGDIVDGGNF